MKLKEKGVHQIHVNVPIETWNILKCIHPNVGEATGLIRRFIIRYTHTYRRMYLNGDIKGAASISINSLIDDAAEEQLRKEG